MVEEKVATTETPTVVKPSRIETSKITDCTCINEYQDKRYGHHKRVHTTNYKASSIKGHTCTVCGQFKPQK